MLHSVANANQPRHVASTPGANGNKVLFVGVDSISASALPQPTCTQVGTTSTLVGTIEFIFILFHWSVVAVQILGQSTGL